MSFLYSAMQISSLRYCKYKTARTAYVVKGEPSIHTEIVGIYLVQFELLTECRQCSWISYSFHCRRIYSVENGLFLQLHGFIDSAAISVCLQTFPTNRNMNFRSIQ